MDISLHGELNRTQLKQLQTMLANVSSPWQNNSVCCSVSQNAALFRPQSAMFANKRMLMAAVLQNAAMATDRC
ncbi:hypothetical protein [Shigella boydii]|uniref:hypothetical protein n=1 Tax=Shigella boydii TaxID=621 RepID=UPI0025421A46|nr:hypothetical protein [Shigella boydii]